MPRKPPADKLGDVARLAGVSPMTVSRALRNSPHVTPETRARVLRAADKLAYRPNPHMARLMAIMRATKRRPVSSVIGLVRDDLPDDVLHDAAYQYTSAAAMRDRALRHGFLVEEFFLGRSGLTARRLQSVLYARGIEGLVVSPQSSRMLAADLEFTQLAAATMGYGLQTPALHRVCANMTEGILMSMAELERRGYRRIGIAITRWVDERSGHMYSGGLLFHQMSVPRRSRVPLLFFPGNDPGRGEQEFCAWMKKFRPDAVISFHSYVPDWLTRRLGLRMPDDIGLVVHDWNESMTGFAGISHRRSIAAATAVDLVATQLIQNERGVPEVPKQILIPPQWIDGASIRSRPTATASEPHS